jgi:hypothetical protein
MALDLARTRVLLFEQLDNSIPAPFLVILIFWLFIIFISFGLFAPKKGLFSLRSLCAHYRCLGRYF